MKRALTGVLRVYNANDVDFEPVGKVVLVEVSLDVQSLCENSGCQKSVQRSVSDNVCMYVMCCFHRVE